MSEECCKRNFGDSLKDTAKRLLDNPRLAPRAVAQERLKTCEACNRYISENMQCSLCLCIMPVKATFANMSCPLDLWGEWTPGKSDEN